MLPIMQSDNSTVTMLQTRWASELNPVLSNPIVNGLILPNVTLLIGSNTINHKLGRKLQGWTLIRKRADAAIYDTQDSNTMPALTLTLTTDANVVVDLYVF